MKHDLFLPWQARLQSAARQGWTRPAYRKVHLRSDELQIWRGAAMKFVTKTQINKVSSPACSPRYNITIPALTRCEKVNGRWAVADTSKVTGSNSHDLKHYYIWLDDADVMEAPNV